MKNYIFVVAYLWQLKSVAKISLSLLTKNYISFTCSYSNKCAVFVCDGDSRVLHQTVPCHWLLGDKTAKGKKTSEHRGNGDVFCLA